MKVSGSRFKMMTWKHFFCTGICACRRTCGIFEVDRSVSGIDTAVLLQRATRSAPRTARCCCASSTRCWTSFHTLCCSACCWPLLQAEHQALQILGLLQYNSFAVLMVMNSKPCDVCPSLSHSRTHLLITVPKMRCLQALRGQLKCFSVFITQSRAVDHLALAEML